MTQQEQNYYWSKWHRFQQKYERHFEKKFAAALKVQVNAYLETNDIMSIPSYPIYTVMAELYSTVGPSWARVTRMDMNKDGRMGFNEEIIRLMNEYYGIDLLNDAEGITAYTRQIIAGILAQASQEGLSINDIVKLITSNSELGAMRARRIARTETVTSANGAAMIYAQQSGNVMNKTWISVHDSRTRHTLYANHVSIDGTTLPIDQPFVLTAPKTGRVEMMQPGVRMQNNGLAVPASQVVNCRCTVAFRAKRDSNGRIIRR